MAIVQVKKTGVSIGAARLVRMGFILALAGGMAACGSIGLGGGDSTAPSDTIPQDAAAAAPPTPAGPTAPALAAPQGSFFGGNVCPKAEIRTGLQSLEIYEKGKDGDATALRHQVSLQRVARECTSTGSQIAMRVGAAGRVLGGPKGTAGPVTFPVRVIVQVGGQPIYQKVHQLTSTLAAPDFSALFTLVDDQVVLPTQDGEQAFVYVELVPANEKPAKPARR
jgi:hypothetical protein